MHGRLQFVVVVVADVVADVADVLGFPDGIVVVVVVVVVVGGAAAALEVLVVAVDVEIPPDDDEDLHDVIPR